MGKVKNQNRKSDLGNALIKQKNKMKMSEHSYFVKHGVEQRDDKQKAKL